MPIFSFQNAALKAQPKISNFLVPYNPFSNRSPSKQLKISNFFKADSRNSQEENICSNSLQTAVSSPECIPASPDPHKKRKRNDEPCRRKLLKLDNYNKLLYDESNNDDCQIIERTSEKLQSKDNACKIFKDTTSVKKQADKNNDNLYQLNQNDCETQSIQSDQFKAKKQEMWKKKNGTKPPKFQSRTEKILNSVVKTNEVQDESNVLKAQVKSTGIHSVRDGKTNISKSNILQHKPKSDETKQTANLNNITNSGSVHKIDSSKANTNNTTDVNTPSILVNDDLLNELLGELGTKSEVKLTEDPKLNKSKTNKAIGDSNNELGGSQITVEKNIEIPSSLECLLEIDYNESTTKKSTVTDTTLETGSTFRVRTFSEENDELPVHQQDVPKIEQRLIRDETSTNSKLVPDKSTNICQPKECSSQIPKKIVQHLEVENTENSVSSFLKLYGVQSYSQKTPEKKIELDTNVPTLCVPLTPEKTEEASLISQEVAAVLSVTKSPHVSTPSKKFSAELSAISKINFDDDNEDDWNFSQLDCIE